MKRKMIIALIGMVLIPSIVFASVDFECPQFIPIDIIAGETHEIICTLENKESVTKSAYIRLNISETTGDYPVLEGDFTVVASINETSLECTENNNGNFSCFNGTEEYLFDKAKYSLSLNVTPEPNLLPSNYAFTLSLLTTKVGVDNPDVESTQTTSNTTTGEWTTTINLTTTTDEEENTTVTVSIPNSDTKVNLTLTVLPGTTRQVVALDSGLIVSPENATVESVSYTSSVSDGTTTDSLNITVKSEGTQEILVYVGNLGEPDEIIITLSSGDSYIKTSDKWDYDDINKIIKFNVTFASPISTLLKWITPPAPPGPSPPAPTGGAGPVGGIGLSLSLKITDALKTIEQSVDSSARYSVDVENTGTVDATFELLIGDLPENYYSVSDPITLSSVGGEREGKLHYTLTLPLDATEQTQTFTVTVKGTAGVLTASESYAVLLTVFPYGVVPTTTTTTTTTTRPSVIIPTGAIAERISGFAAMREVQIGGGIVLAFIVSIIVIRAVSIKRRTPWRTNYYKPSHQSKVLGSMKKQIKKRFQKEEWVKRL